jgi:hypothetical protein
VTTRTWTEQLLNGVDDENGIGAGLPLYVENDRGGLIDPGGQTRVFHAIDNLRHVGQHDRRAVAVGNDHLAIVGARDELIVGVDGVVERGSVEVALGIVDRVRRERGADVF